MSQIIGDALVGVCFIRNVFATIIAVSLTYWIEGEWMLYGNAEDPFRLIDIPGIGLSNMIIMSAVLAFALSATTIPMIIYGKRARIWTEERRKKMTLRQFGTRG